MSLNAVTIRLLADKGLSALDIAEIAEAMAAVPSSGAERQRRYRERARAERNDSDVTRDVTERNAGPSPLTPPLKVSPDPFKKSPPLTPQPTPDIPDGISPPISVSGKPEKPSLKPEHVVEAWNDMASRCDLPKAKLTPERRRKLGTFIRRHPIEDITEAIGAVERSRFCRGENDRGWRANIDFLLQPSSFTKLTEGTYDGTSH